jgi:hypothetical protein
MASVCFEPKAISENLKSEDEYKKQLQDSFRPSFRSTLVKMIHIPRFNATFQKTINEYASKVPVVDLPVEKPKIKGGTLGFGNIAKSLGAAATKGLSDTVSGATKELQEGVSGATDGLSESIDKQTTDAKKTFDNTVKNAGQTDDLAAGISPLANTTTNDIGGLLSNNITPTGLDIIPKLGNDAFKLGTKSGLPSGIAELQKLANPSVLNALFSTGIKVVGLGNSKKNLIKAIDAGICEHIRRTKQGLVLWAKRNHIQIVEMLLNKHLGTLTKPNTFDPKPPIKPIVAECLDDPEINEKLEAFNKKKFDILDPFLDDMVAELVAYAQVEIASRIRIKSRIQTTQDIIFKPKKVFVEKNEENPEDIVETRAEEPPPYTENVDVHVSQPVTNPMFAPSAMPDTNILVADPVQQAADTQNQVQATLKSAVPFAAAADAAMNTRQFFDLKEQLIQKIKYLSDTFANSKSSNYDKTPFENWCLEQFYNKLVAYDTNDWLAAYEPPKADDNDPFGGLLEGGRRNKRRSKKRRRKRTAKRRTIRR